MIKWGKAEVNAMAECLDNDFGSAEEAAMAALALAESLFEKRAKFVVVGQLASTREGPLKASDPAAVRMSLGWYSTEGDARAAAESLWSNGPNGETFKVWVLPVHHGTPADFHRDRREKHEKVQAKAKEVQQERLQRSIDKRLADAEERNKVNAKGKCLHCDHFPYDHLTDGNSRGKCGLSSCGCSRFKERTK